MSTFSQIYELGNIRRAYRWILSNSDAKYKNFFRKAYEAYALASDSNLKILARQIKNNRFTPSNASKVYIPKPSGILRTISLLTVDDQICYQACLNVIAEDLQRHVAKRHGKTVFYHRYAGKTSKFFYRRWETSYREFADALRDNFKNGFVYIANFDLTAFYDSIDHHVLGIFLARIGTDADSIAFLLANLKHWTEATWGGGSGRRIYHEHGIPQGPLSSGMLSEVVLQHLDLVGDRWSKDVRYLRYVDDIKIMARDEKTLRRRLVTLDIAAKEIALFPQSSKISIRKIIDPEDEIKSVSVPPETAIMPSAQQDTVRKRIRELANRGHPIDTTRLKFVLPRLDPSAKTNAVLFKVLLNRPDLSDAITRHFDKYRRLPASLADGAIDHLLSEGVYHSSNGNILNTLYGRVDGPRTQQVADFAYERLFAPKYRRAAVAAPQPTYRAALIRWALQSAHIKYSDIEELIRAKDWWVVQEVLSSLKVDKLGRPSFEALLNLGMRQKDSDPARVAASIIFSNSLAVRRRHADCHWAARLLLRNAGLIPYAGRPPSLIRDILAYTVKIDVSFDWQKHFGAAHTSAEQLAILSKQRFETDIDAFIVSLDSFCDLVTRQVYTRRTGQVMKAAYGNVLMSGAPVWLKTDFPSLLNGFGKLHQLRIRSFTAHPRDIKTGILNKRITHSQYFRIRKVLVAAFEELSRVLPI